MQIKASTPPKLVILTIFFSKTPSWGVSREFLKTIFAKKLSASKQKQGVVVLISEGGPTTFFTASVVKTPHTLGSGDKKRAKNAYFCSFLPKIPFSLPPTHENTP